MIVLLDDKPSKSSPDQKVDSKESQMGLDKPPPSYTPLPESSSTNTASLPTFKTKPTNYLSLFSAQNPIQGEFVIDPSIHIPSSVLPPLDKNETEDDRKNLYLSSRSSSVCAEIWLLGSTTSGEITLVEHKPRRTTIRLLSDYGSIYGQVHTLDCATPFSLMARAGHGEIRLGIPRSFHGLLSLSTRHGNIFPSNGLVQNATQLSPLDTTRRYFVGDLQAVGEDTWDGDKVELEAPYGSIWLGYVDEVEKVQGKKRLLSRSFGK